MIAKLAGLLDQVTSDAAVVDVGGVGPRLAARIANELRDKIGGLATAAPLPVAATPASGNGSGTGATADAVSALVNLGYRRAEAFGAVATAARKLGDKAALDALIRAGLQELGQPATQGTAR